MNQDEVIAKLQSIFDDLLLDPTELAPQTTADDVPEWDSLMQITILVSVEKEFNVRFRVGEVEKTNNVGQFADLIILRMK